MFKYYCTFIYKNKRIHHIKIGKMVNIGQFE